MAVTGKRQQIRLREVRPPDVINDSSTEAQVRAIAASGTLEDFEQFTSLVLSVLRSIQGSTGWNVPPAPEAAPELPIYIDAEVIAGTQNGSNLVFKTAYKFSPQTVHLFVNGLRQRYGADSDYICAESGGPGTGFDTIMFASPASAPRATDQLLADYEKAT